MYICTRFPHPEEFSIVEVTPNTRIAKPPFARTLLALLVALLTTTTASAQVLRGTVVDKSSRAPVPGVVLTLFDDQKSKLANVLSAADGTYELRAPNAGRFTLVVQRIGVRPSTSPPFSLDLQEARRMDLEVDAVVPALSVVRVSGSSQCKTISEGGEDVVRLWDDARGALTATTITTKRVERAPVTRFEREVDAETGRVLRDRRSSSVEPIGKIFRSIPAATLARDGFLVRQSDGTIDYFAPDAEVLISDEFVSTHCFRAVRSESPEGSRVGLEFSPSSNSRLFDIVGVLWLDGKSSELREVVYRYQALPRGIPGDPEADSLGGRVRFSRLADGRWYVKDWHIRMPLTAARTLGMAMKLVSVRITGGTIGDAVSSETTITIEGTRISGVVFDSITSAPARSVVVTLDGTEIRGVTDADGRFALSGVPPGTYSISAAIPSLDSVGVRMASSVIEVGPVSKGTIRLATPSLRSIVAKLCTQLPVSGSDVVVRLTIVHAGSTNGLAGANGRARWTTYSAPGSGIAETKKEMTFTLDERGQATLCGVPSNTPVYVESMPNAQDVWRDTMRLAPLPLVAKTLEVRVEAGGVASTGIVAAQPRKNSRVRLIEAEPSLGKVDSASAPRAFLEHRTRSLGKFVGPEVLRLREDARVSDILRNIGGGVRVITLPNGGATLATGSVPTESLVAIIRGWSDGSGVYQVACYLQVFLDGIRVWTWNGPPPVDLDSYSVKSLSGIEVYGSHAETPPEFGGMTICGTVALWTRR